MIVHVNVAQIEMQEAITEEQKNLVCKYAYTFVSLTFQGTLIENVTEEVTALRMRRFLSHFFGIDITCQELSIWLKTKVCEDEEQDPRRTEYVWRTEDEIFINHDPVLHAFATTRARKSR